MSTAWRGFCGQAWHHLAEERPSCARPKVGRPWPHSHLTLTRLTAPGGLVGHEAHQRAALRPSPDGKAGTWVLVSAFNSAWEPQSVSQHYCCWNVSAAQQCDDVPGKPKTGCVFPHSQNLLTTSTASNGLFGQFLHHLHKPRRCQ